MSIDVSDVTAARALLIASADAESIMLFLEGNKRKQAIIQSAHPVDCCLLYYAVSREGTSRLLDTGLELLSTT